MFICYKCKNLSKPREQLNKIILETRPVTYYESYKSTDDEGNPITVKNKVQGHGFETVKEVNVCKNCL